MNIKTITLDKNEIPILRINSDGKTYINSAQASALLSKLNRSIEAKESPEKKEEEKKLFPLALKFIENNEPLIKFIKLNAYASKYDSADIYYCKSKNLEKFQCYVESYSPPHNPNVKDFLHSNVGFPKSASFSTLKEAVKFCVDAIREAHIYSKEKPHLIIREKLVEMQVALEKNPNLIGERFENFSFPTSLKLDFDTTSSISSKIETPDPKMDTLIEDVETFLEEQDTKLYLLPASKRILLGELTLAKAQKPNELKEWFEKYQIVREKRKKTILETNASKELNEYERYQHWKGTRSKAEILKELGELRKQFDKLSHKEHSFPIGEHTQRKYRVQNQVNGIVKLMNMIENGLKQEEKMPKSYELFSVDQYPSRPHTLKLRGNPKIHNLDIYIRETLEALEIEYQYDANSYGHFSIWKKSYKSELEKIYNPTKFHPHLASELIQIIQDYHFDVEVKYPKPYWSLINDERIISKKIPNRLDAKKFREIIHSQKYKSIFYYDKNESQWNNIYVIDYSKSADQILKEVVSLFEGLKTDEEPLDESEKPTELTLMEEIHTKPKSINTRKLSKKGWNKNPKSKKKHTKGYFELTPAQIQEKMKQANENP